VTDPGRSKNPEKRTNGKIATGTRIRATVTEEATQDKVYPCKTVENVL